MKLKVIAGAKEGVEIPLKKSKFVIGRASDCTLRASSDAISRHHCALLRYDSGEVAARDLGSRNGTLINGKKISAETPLADGDELQIGPLRFQVLAPADLKRQKKPAVKSVAEAIERVAKTNDSDSVEDDISRWLLGPEPGTKISPPIGETQTVHLDETQTLPKPAGKEEADGTETIMAPEAEADDDSANDSKAGKRKKLKPGKLPPLPQKPSSKDSCEAAADILREMARRR